MSLCISLSSDTHWQARSISHLSPPRCTSSSRCTFVSQVLAPISPAGFGAWPVWLELLSSLCCCCSKICGHTWLHVFLFLDLFYHNTFASHCLFPTRNTGVYYKGHWVRDSTTPRSGDPSITERTCHLLIHSHLPHTLDFPIDCNFNCRKDRKIMVSIEKSWAQKKITEPFCCKANQGITPLCYIQVLIYSLCLFCNFLSDVFLGLAFGWMVFGGF